jgi:hypothetical protein
MNLNEHHCYICRSCGKKQVWYDIDFVNNKAICSCGHSIDYQDYIRVRKV